MYNSRITALFWSVFPIQARVYIPVNSRITALFWSVFPIHARVYIPVNSRITRNHFQPLFKVISNMQATLLQFWCFINTTHYSKGSRNRLDLPKVLRGLLSLGSPGASFRSPTPCFTLDCRLHRVYFLAPSSAFKARLVGKSSKRPAHSRKWPAHSRKRPAHSRKRPAPATTTFSNSRDCRLRELQLYRESQELSTATSIWHAFKSSSRSNFKCVEIISRRIKVKVMHSRQTKSMWERFV